MARKQIYPCFKCRENGFPNTMVFLAGKNNEGTIYIEEDGTAHQHKQKQQQRQDHRQENIELMIRLEQKIDLLTKMVLALSSASVSVIARGTK